MKATMQLRVYDTFTLKCTDLSAAICNFTSDIKFEKINNIE